MLKQACQTFEAVRAAPRQSWSSGATLGTFSSQRYFRSVDTANLPIATAALPQTRHDTTRQDQTNGLGALTVSICSTRIPLDPRCFTSTGSSLAVILSPTPMIMRSGQDSHRTRQTHRIKHKTPSQSAALQQCSSFFLGGLAGCKRHRLCWKRRTPTGWKKHYLRAESSRKHGP